MALLEGEASKEQLTIAGQAVSVRRAIRPIRRGFWHNLFFGALSLYRGMRVTGRYFWRRSEWVTQEYPENRNELKMFERYRATLTLKYDQNGLHNCTGCKICEEACPNRSIQVIDMKGASGKTEIDRYIWRMDICTFCNLCVMVCPHDALEMVGSFESSVLDRRLLVFQLNRYAGPTKKNLEKIAEIGEREAVIRNLPERKPYEGEVPLAMALSQKQSLASVEKSKH